jgi:hypothetical protein
VGVKSIGAENTSRRVVASAASAASAARHSCRCQSHSRPIQIVTDAATRLRMHDNGRKDSRLPL